MNNQIRSDQPNVGDRGSKSPNRYSLYASDPLDSMSNHDPEALNYQEELKTTNNLSDSSSASGRRSAKAIQDHSRATNCSDKSPTNTENVKKTKYSHVENEHNYRPKSQIANTTTVKFHRRTELEVEQERKLLVNSQSKDKVTVNRNKRMLGMLIGTLEKFKHEETQREEQQKSKLVRDVEENEIAQGDPQLIINCSNDQCDYTDEVTETNVVDLYDNWDKTYRHLGCFIKTETKPKIFWIPKEHTPETERKLRVNRDYYKLLIAEREAKLSKSAKETT